MMFEVTTALLLGLLTGFLNSIPVGPIGVSIVDTAFKRGFLQAMMIGIGALVVDIGYCVVAVFGVSAIQHRIEYMLQPLGFPVLSLLGGRLVYKGARKTAAPVVHVAPRNELTKNFSLGFLIYLSNPLPIGFWIFAVGILYSYHWLRPSLTEQIVFIGGMALGTAAWFLMLAKWAVWKRTTISDETVKRITLVSGFTLMAFGLYMGWEYFSIN